MIEVYYPPATVMTSAPEESLLTWKYGHMAVYGVQLHVTSGTLVVVISNLSGDQELVVVIQNLLETCQLSRN